MIASLASLLIMGSCQETLWNRSYPEIHQLMSSGDWDFLRELTPEDLEPSKVQLLGEGSAHYMGLVLGRLNRHEESNRLLIHSLKRDPLPWSLESAKFLLKRDVALKNYAQAVQYGEEFLLRALGDREVERLVFEAYYWQKLDTQAWNLLKTWKQGDFSASQERENWLFEGAVRGRLMQKGWQEPLLKLVQEVGAGALHLRALSFFEEDPTRWESLSPLEVQQLRFKSEVARGSWTRARDAFKLMNTPAHWFGSGLLSDYETFHRQTNQMLKGARDLESMAGSFPLSLQFSCYFSAARLFRFAENWPDALRLFREAFAKAASAEEQEKALWNLLHVSFQMGVEPGIAVLGEYASSVTSALNREYFSDHFQLILGRMVSERRWGDLAAVYPWIESWADSNTLAEWSYLLARIQDYGIYDLRKSGLPWTSQDLFQRAAESQPRGYFGLLALAFLGQEPHLWQDEFSPQGEEETAEKFWISRYLDFGLKDEAFQKAFSLDTQLEVKDIRSLAKTLHDKKEYRSSLRLMSRLWQRPDFSPTRQDWRLLYPRGYEELVLDRSLAEGIDFNLFFALIRQESTFDPLIKSHAGAVGLAQLMPDTAKDVAGRLRLVEYDVTDPEDNLRLGARYLAMRLENLGHPAQALMAYNAGISRVRGWNRSLGDLPDELYNAAVPFGETRDYVRRILAGAVFYGIIYNSGSWPQLVNIIYPGIIF